MREVRGDGKKREGGPFQTLDPSLRGPNAVVSNVASSTPARNNEETGLEELPDEMPAHLLPVMCDSMSSRWRAGRQDEDRSWALQGDEFERRDMRSLSS
jgi:hypothetical protein